MKNKFDIREFLKKTKIELGEYKTTVESNTFKGINDNRRNQRDVIITEDGKLDLYTRKEITVNEDTNSEQWVGYIIYPTGKKLKKVFKSKRAAEMWRNKNSGRISKKLYDIVYGIGIMTKKEWDKKEARWAI